MEYFTKQDLKKLSMKDMILMLINDCQLKGKRLEVEIKEHRSLKKSKLVYNVDELAALKEAIIICHSEDLKSQHFKIYGFKQVD